MIGHIPIDQRGDGAINFWIEYVGSDWLRYTVVWKGRARYAQHIVYEGYEYETEGFRCIPSDGSITITHTMRKMRKYERSTTGDCGAAEG